MVLAARQPANHSKIAVIDGRTGFVGGINIAERYLDGDALGRWRDEHLRIEGEAVDDLQRLFAADWALEGGEPLSEGLYAARALRTRMSAMAWPMRSSAKM